MAPPPDRWSVQELLQHQVWLRKLAVRLAEDAGSADELVQRTWLAVLVHPPRRAGPLRGWLASVVRNFARQERRARSCRAGHEHQAAATEALPSAADVVARAGVQRAVAEAVFELDEPYRTTVMLRYFDDLTPSAIAEQMNVPAATVRTRLARALAQLRQRLDRERGGRELWLPALAPLLPRPTQAPPLLTGSILMSTKLLISALIVVAGSLALYLLVHEDGGAAVPLAAGGAAPTDAAPGPSSAATPPTAESVGQTRSAVAGAVAPEHSAGSAQGVRAADAALLRGRVIDELGAALAQMPLGFESSSHARATDVVATSGADGRFEMPRPGSSGVIVGVRPGYATLLAGVPGDDSGSIEPVVVMGRAAALAGRVFGEEGLPVAGARVEVQLPESFRSRLQVVLDRSVDRNWAGESDARGGFAFAAVPLVEGARLRARADGYQPFDGPLAENLGSAVLLTLARPRSSDGFVRGKVVDDAGEPVGGAQVAFGAETLETGKDGTFAFALEDKQGFNARFELVPETLVALKRGYQPAQYAAPRRDGKLDWPANVTLQLGSTPLSVSGRVVGHDRKPLSGVQVWLADAAFFGAGKQGPLLVENLLAGEPGKRWRFVESDSKGEFTIDGLVAREYTLRAMDPRTLLHEDVKAVAAGTTGLEIRLPTDELVPRVAGKVVGHDGTPLAGVKVFPMCDAFRMRIKGQVRSTSHADLDGTTTDAAGRFELTNLPKSFVYLRIEGEEILPLEYGRDTHDLPGAAEGSSNRIPDKDLEQLVIAVDRRCHLQVELADPSSADALCVLDEQGRKLDINVYVGSGRRTSDSSPITEGKSNTMAVTDAARTLVLMKGEVEVSRSQLKLTPGQTTKVKL